MILKDLLEKIDYEVLQGNDEVEVSHLQNDSRKVVDNDV